MIELSHNSSPKKNLQELIADTYKVLYNLIVSD